MKNLLYIAFIGLCLTIFTTKNSIAQTATIEDVFSIRLRSSGIIKDNDGIKGYYFFYKKEKVDRKTNTYILQIIDENLNEVAKKEITDTKQLILQSGTYNGEVIMLKFYDYKKKELSYRSFTKEGKLVNSDKETIANKYRMATYKLTDGDVTKPASMYSLGKKGFVDYSYHKGKRYGYQINFVPAEKGAKKWKFKSDDNIKNTLSGNYLYGDDDILISSVMDRPRLLSMKGMRYYIASNSVNTGKQEWKTELVDPKFEISLLNTYPEKDKGQVVLFGSYFKKGANMAKAKSLGLFSFIMDMKTGEITKRNFISWVEDAGKFLNVNDKGKIQSVGYVFFHQFIKTADGRIFGIGEQYRKAVSALGVASSLMGGEASGIKMVIEDFYIFEFNEDFSLKNINVFEKGKSNVLLDQGMGMVSAAKLAKYLDMMGFFDFYYAQTQDGGEVMHICYLDYDRAAKGESKKTYFGVISYADGEFSNDRIVLERKWRTSINVYPAKAGYALVQEYNRKERKIEMRLEKINF